jgi:hypothetical protein
VLGWLGLNTATEHQPTGSVEVNPVVGVRHQTVERMVAEIRGQAFHPYVPPTVCTSIGYVMPERSYTAWEIGDGSSSAVDDMVRAVEHDGLAYMRRLRDLPTLCQAAEEGRATAPEYQLPVIRVLLGRRKRALDGLAEDVHHLGDRQDPAAHLLRAFAAAFAAYVDAAR